MSKKVRGVMAGQIQRIFNDHWSDFLRLPNVTVRKVVKEDVSRMINCGDLKNGHRVYTCPSCSEVKKVAFRCKSRFCTSCGKVYVDDRAEAMSNKLIKVTHRHMVFTIPEELRIYFRKQRELLSLLPKLAYEVIKLYFHKQSKKESYTPGVVAVIHTFGGDLKWNPHVHMLVTEGGVGESVDWKQVNYFHYERLRKSWQKALLNGLESAIKKEKRKYANLKKKLYAIYRDGFYVYGKRRINNNKSATKYVGRYTGRPAIADSRIIDYDGETVSYYYTDKETKERKVIKESAYEFIKKVIIHIAERGFKMIRYYGIYANKRKKKCKVLKMVHEKIREMNKKFKSWRKRLHLSFGDDPLLCLKCGCEMELTDIVYPEIGSVLDLIQKRTYDKIEKEIFELQENHDILKVKMGYEPLYV